MIPAVVAPLFSGLRSPPRVVFGQTRSTSNGNSVSFTYSCQAGDLLLIVAETENEGADNVVGETFTRIAAATVGTGTAGSSSAVGIDSFYRIADGTETQAFISSAGSGHVFGLLLIIEGVDVTDPFIDVQADVQTPGSTSVVWPSVTNDDDCSLVVYVGATNRDSASANFSSQNSTRTAEFIEYIDSGTANNDGGGLCAWGGITSYQGTLEAATGLMATSDLQCRASFLIRSIAPVMPEGAVAQTLPGLEQVANADLSLSGSVAQVAPRLGQLASSAIIPEGEVAQILPKVQQASAGVAQFSATVAQVLPKVAQAAAASERHPAAVAQVAPAVIQAAAAQETLPATVAQVLPKVTQAAAAEETLAAAVAQVLPAVEQAISAAETLPAGVAQTLPGVTQAAGAEHQDTSVAGTVAQVLPTLQQAVQSEIILSGAVVQVTPKVAQHADGAVTYEGIGATVAQILPFLQQGVEAEIDASSVLNPDWVMRLRRRRRRAA